MFKAKLLISTPNLLYQLQPSPSQQMIALSFHRFSGAKPSHHPRLPSCMSRLLHQQILLLALPSNMLRFPLTSHHYYPGPHSFSTFCEGRPHSLLCSRITCSVLKLSGPGQAATSFKLSLPDSYFVCPPTLLHFWPQDTDFSSHLLKNSNH